MGSLRAEFLRSLRIASKPYAERGWSLRGAGLVCRGDDGCWGQIAFLGASANENRHPIIGVVDPPRLSMKLIAGAHSAYLTRVLRKLDPVKPPTANYYPHAVVKLLVNVTLTYERGTESPRWSSEDVEHVELTPDTTAAWLQTAFDDLVPATDALNNELSIRDWLSAAIPRIGPGRTWDVRQAILLTRHLHRGDELAALVERAKQSYAVDVERFPLITGRDRQTLRPNEWSHDRFMRFVEEIDP